MTDKAILSENYPEKAQSAFASADTAQLAAHTLREQLGEKARVEVIEPQDPAIDRKLEPETREVRSTLVRTHVVFGSAGLVAGLLFIAALWLMGLEAITSNPGLAWIAGAFIGLLLGLLLGGLVAARPDEMRLAAHARDAAAAPRTWSVVVHCTDSECLHQASELLQRQGAEVHRTAGLSGA